MFPQNLQHYLKTNNVLIILSAIVLVWAIYSYSNNKSLFSGFTPNTNSVAGGKRAAGNGNGRPHPQPVDDSSVYNQLSSPSSSNMIGLPPNCSGHANINPADLLPKDNNSSWNLKPMGSGDFQGVNLLNAGYLIGVNPEKKDLLSE